MVHAHFRGSTHPSRGRHPIWICRVRFNASAALLSAPWVRDKWGAPDVVRIRAQTRSRFRCGTAFELGLGDGMGWWWRLGTTRLMMGNQKCRAWCLHLGFQPSTFYFSEDMCRSNLVRGFWDFCCANVVAKMVAKDMASGRIVEYIIPE